MDGPGCGGAVGSAGGRNDGGGAVPDDVADGLGALDGLLSVLGDAPSAIDAEGEPAGVKVVLGPGDSTAGA